MLLQKGRLENSLLFLCACLHLEEGPHQSWAVLVPWSQGSEKYIFVVYKPAGL